MLDGISPHLAARMLWEKVFMKRRLVEKGIFDSKNSELFSFIISTL